MERSVRLLTLWGPPGIGKTRLACALVQDVAPAAFLSLQSIADVEDLNALVEPRLASRTRGWVVLDNLEHLLSGPNEGQAVVERIQRWLSDAPGVSFLVTSRRRIHLPHEHALELLPLDPTDAVELFVQCVRRRSYDLETDDGELHELVQVLEGLPLAIELAAARWELLGTRGLIDRMSGSIQLLTHPRPIDAKHATLRRAIAWSWSLLSEEDQRALEALCTFRERFGISDAEALLGPDALCRLGVIRDHALVRVPVPGQFEVLASIKTFIRNEVTRERAEALADAHAEWLLQRFPDPDRPAALGVVRADLQSAARHLVRRKDPRAGHLLELLNKVDRPCHGDLIDQALAQHDSARLRLVRSRVRFWAGRFDAARDDAETGLVMAPDRATKAWLHMSLGAVAHHFGDLEAAEKQYEAALANADTAGVPRTEAVALINLAMLDYHHDRFESSEERYQLADLKCRTIGDHQLQARAVMNRSMLLFRQGMLTAAETSLCSVIEIFEQARDYELSAKAKFALGLVYHEQGRLSKSLETHEQAWDHLQHSPDALSRGMCLAALAGALAALGDPSTARHHLDRAMGIVGPAGHDATQRFIELFYAFVDQAEGRDEAVKDRLRAAHDHVVLRAIARSVTRILRQTTPGVSSVLEVGPDWFVPPMGERVNLSRHASLCRMFHALVNTAETGGVIDVDGLFGAGWPHEQVALQSAHNRVHVNLVKLRNLGLRDLILRANGGYQLDPTVDVAWRGSEGARPKTSACSNCRTA
ncbi:MAG: hypothetical protein AAGA48_34580 [Myxococcota bacterium]